LKFVFKRRLRLPPLRKDFHERLSAGDLF